MYLVDQCHRNGIGVILDWVPGHFCRDAHGLRHFDGEPLYESGNPLLAENKDWDTMNFDYGRPEVRSFLISSALFWLEEYHFDGLRIDAVAACSTWTMGKKRENGRPTSTEDGRTWKRGIPPAAEHGGVPGNAPGPDGGRGKHHLAAGFPAGGPGGLGFNYKWNMGWMNDMLQYMSTDPLFRKGCQDLITFSLYYAFSENFILPLSHDEVVHGKKSLIDRMPGDYWQKFAGLRAFYGYWMSHPGKKLLFMGGEFGQFIEWRYAEQLDWLLLDYPMHRQMQDYSRDLNRYYLDHPEFWQEDFDWKGFQWISCDDRDNSVIAFVRTGKEPGTETVVVCNFTPVVRREYRIGAPEPGTWQEVFNSDAEAFGGSGVRSGTLQENGKVEIRTEKVPCHGREQSLVLTLPSLAVVYFQRKKETAEKQNTPLGKKKMEGDSHESVIGSV